MAWSSMRGRPRDLPVDHTPLRGARVDTRARIAWLLRVSRMASPRGGTGAEFSRKLRDAGLPIGASALSRREHGQEEISGAMISAYEAVLGLPEGHLRGVCDSLRRQWNVHTGERVVPPSRAQIAASLRRIDGRIERGSACGADWLELSRVLVEPGGAVLPPSVLGAWVRTLLREMLRSVGGAYVGRVEALAGLMSDPVTRRTVVDAALEVIHEPGAACLIDTVTVLGESSADDSVGRLIDLLVNGRGTVRLGAARALLQPIVTGDLTVQQINAVERAIVTIVRDDPDDAGDAAFMLAQRISLRMTQMVVTALGRNPGERPPGSHVQAPAQLDRYLSDAARHSGLHGDQMLDRLVREALTDDFLERQHSSSMILMVSPFRRVLADTAIDVLTSVHDPAARSGATSLLSYLAAPEQRPQFMGMLRRPDVDLQRTALRCLAHTGGVPFEMDLMPYLRNEELCRDALYCAGMSAHPALQSAASCDEFPQSLRDTARWWIALGPVIREGDCVADDPLIESLAQGGAQTPTMSPKPTKGRISLARPAEVLV